MSRAKMLSVFTAAVMISGMCSGLNVSAKGELDMGDLTKNTLIQTKNGIAIDNDVISDNTYKSVSNNNPISSEVFCADPTAIEYNGRLYVFGTNDHQQCNEKGINEDNTYEKIKSLVVFSTNDMANWVYHGEINVGKIAPWITNSWAPTICSRVEADGLTHFYMYFSNNGTGVGVITSTDPLGPWEDPLGKPLVSTDTEGLGDCPNPFDPGVVIDDDGVGWLSFGAGIAANGTDYMPGSGRIVRLGEDMLSFDSPITEIPAPYLFEASELNFINGTYVYTYNSNWSDHSQQWDYDCDPPSMCSMVYMTTKTPLDPNSWEMKGECFKNPGLSGFEYSNNHTHMHKYKGKWYMLYHTLALKNAMGIKGGYRSLAVDEINVDEDSVTIEKTGGTKKGVNAADTVDPFTAQSGAQVNSTADITFDTDDMSNPLAVSDNAGAWTSVKNVKFSEGDNDTANQTESSEQTLTSIDTMTYEINVKEVSGDTTITMYPSSKSGDDCIGSVKVTGTGKYTITCDIGGAEQMQNLGYFRASDGASITFELDSLTVNGKYEFDISSELTNTREWADGLKNIWNGFADGDEVYSSDNAEFRYIAADEAIELFAGEVTQSSNDDAQRSVSGLAFLAEASGNGRIEVRLDSPAGELLTSIDIDSQEGFLTVFNNNVADIGGIHDLYFVYSDKDLIMKRWQFASASQTSTYEEQQEESVPKTNNDSSGDEASPDNNSAKTVGGNDNNADNPKTGSSASAVMFMAAAIITVISKKRR